MDREQTFYRGGSQFLAKPNEVKIDRYTGFVKPTKQQAREAYRQFKQDPRHLSLHFKQVHQELPIYSARVGKNYRAVGQRNGDSIVWFLIGTHADYDKLLSQL